MKISVIVPVYNSERYLRKCIKSVQKQSYKNWELILIDDGSTDNTSQIIESAVIEDRRIKVLYKKNEGPGIARNFGIELATGDYVVFLDSDDYISNNYFELIAKKKLQYDVIFIDVNLVLEDGTHIKKQYSSIYKNCYLENIIRLQLTGKIPWGGVRKVVRLKLLKEHNIRYTYHKIGEEALYSFKILYHAKSVGFIEENPVYYYVDHKNSQSKLKIDDPWGPVVKTVREYLLEEKLYEYYGKTLNSFNLTATVISLDRIQRYYKGRLKKKKAEERIEEFFKIYDNQFGLDYNSLSFKVKVFVYFVLKRNYYPIFIASFINKYWNILLSLFKMRGQE